MRFAMNHMVTPGRSLEEFLGLSKALGVLEVEIRNDLPDIVGRMPPDAVGAAAEKAGVTILSINALYPFNVWSEELSTRTEALADYARDCGARALVMCPLNDGTEVALDGAVAALERIGPLLESRSLIGLVEPLGFPVSSLRMKALAVEAIEAANGQGVFELVHDTFHHHLAGEREFFAEWTGLVHISGVTDRSVAVEDMLDDHRVLVDEDDRLGNVAQIGALLAAGYDGPFSFEPFASDVHELVDPETAIRASMGHVTAQVRGSRG